jgi:hypothetical protein
VPLATGQLARPARRRIIWGAVLSSAALMVALQFLIPGGWVSLPFHLSTWYNFRDFENVQPDDRRQITVHPGDVFTLHWSTTRADCGAWGIDLDENSPVVWFQRSSQSSEGWPLAPRRDLYMMIQAQAPGSTQVAYELTCGGTTQRRSYHVTVR